MILPQMNTACGEDAKAAQNTASILCVSVSFLICLLHVIKKDLTVQLIHVHQNDCCISM